MLPIRENYCFRCGRKFEPARSDQMYCSKRCRLLEYKSRRQAERADKKTQEKQYGK